MPRGGFWWAVLVLASLNGVAADEPKGGPVLTAEQRQQLKERDRLAGETASLRRAGKLAEAVLAAEQMLAIERAVLGDSHEDVAGSLQQLAELHEERDDVAAARKA